MATFTVSAVMFFFLWVFLFSFIVHWDSMYLLIDSADKLISIIIIPPKLIHNWVSNVFCFLKNVKCLVIWDEPTFKTFLELNVTTFILTLSCLEMVKTLQKHTEKCQPGTVFHLFQERKYQDLEGDHDSSHRSGHFLQRWKSGVERWAWAPSAPWRGLLNEAEEAVLQPWTSGPFLLK